MWNWLLATSSRELACQSRNTVALGYSLARALKIVAAQPIFGVGPANFPVVAESYGWTEGKQAHSVWMQTAAENGVPGVALLLLFFGATIVKLWPIAQLKQTEENRYRVAVASGIIMSIVGFCIAGQFVSLAGLEIPYYVAMIGVGGR